MATKNGTLDKKVSKLECEVIMNILFEKDIQVLSKIVENIKKNPRDAIKYETVMVEVYSSLVNNALFAVRVDLASDNLVYTRKGVPVLLHKKLNGKKELEKIKGYG